MINSSSTPHSRRVLAPGIRGADLVVIDGQGGLSARRLVWIIGYGPPQRYVGLYEIRAPQASRGASHLRGMMMATLRASRFQPRVSYRLRGLALRPALWPAWALPNLGNFPSCNMR